MKYFSKQFSISSILAAFFLPIFLANASAQAAPRRVIIDTDPGTDDAMAIMLALNSQELDVRALVQKIHAAVLASGVFKVGAVRTRAERREVYVIADGDPDYAFMHVDIRMAPGRDPTTRKSVAQGVLDTIVAETRDVFARTGLGLSVEVHEIDNSASLRRNNLHERVAAKGLAVRAPT